MELDWFQIAAALVGVQPTVLHLALLGIGGVLLAAAFWPKRNRRPRARPDASASGLRA